jgi:Right handed beta helix region
MNARFGQWQSQIFNVRKEVQFKRESDMKTGSSMVVVLVVMCFGMVCAAHAAGPVYCDVTVIGQEVPALDIPAVESAINNPLLSGKVTVCLQGTFDFGTGAPLASFARIDPPAAVGELNIAGLDDADGNKAAIKNGSQPLAFISTFSLPVLTIRNLRFEQPRISAISIFSGNELVEVSDVQIEGVVTGPIISGGSIFRIRQGIAVTSVLSEVKGRIVIKDNTIDGGAYGARDARIDVNGGIVVVSTSPTNPFPITGDILIQGNIVRNWSGNGINISGPAKVAIEKNLIQPGPFANLVPNPNACVANGIFITHNESAVVEGNTIEMVTALTATNTSPCTAGIVLAMDANNDVFKANKVIGTGRYAIAVMGNPANPDQNNLFLGNNLTGFSPTGATVSLGPFATNNTFVGNSGTVVGNTGANTITGLTPVAGGVGDAVSDGVSD